MIKCPKCDADNQIGAIFCRGCGEKLNLDDIQPDVVRDAAAKAVEQRGGWDIGRIIRNVIGLGLLAALVGVLLMLYMAPAVPSIDASEKDVAKIESEIDEYLKGSSGKLTLSGDELNHAADVFMLTTAEEIEERKTKAAEDGGGLALELTDVYVELLETEDTKDSARVRIVIREQSLSKDWMRLYRSVEGTVTCGEKGGLQLDVDKAYLGRMPMHHVEGLKEKVLEHFRIAIEGKGPFKQFVNKTRSFKTREGEDVQFRR